MSANHEIFLAHIERIFGATKLIKKHECPSGGPPVSVFIYHDIPSPGMITGVTYGLSLYPHAEWRKSRPEMIISMESADEMWTFAAAYFAAEFRGVKRFSYGDVFTTDTSLASDTEMDGLLVFAQSILEPEMQAIQFYPIYRSELETYDKIGFESFWKHDGFSMYDPKRKPIRD